MIAYGYAYEYGEEPDYEAAYEAIDKSIALHGGPNALDKSEIAAMEGDYQKAFTNQLKAVTVILHLLIKQNWLLIGDQLMG